MNYTICGMSKSRGEGKGAISALSVSCADSDAKLVPLVLSQRESQEPSFEYPKGT